MIVMQPSTAQSPEADPLAAPSAEVSNVERGRQADAARLEGVADRWINQNCGPGGPPSPSGIAR
jgi:hypothetical protein